MELQIERFIKDKSALVVEDEGAISLLLKMNLEGMGFTVDCCMDAESAIELLTSKKYDLCLLDWMLPKIQGIELLKKIRPQFTLLKVMMITAKVDSDSIVMGLDAGADDYLPKPFDNKVLAARVRQLMRRHYFDSLSISKVSSEQLEEKGFEFDGLIVDFSKHIVSVQNIEVHLTLSEFKLLKALIRGQGTVLTRQQLIDQIQGEDVSVTGRTVDTHIFSLRKKIGDWSQYIETIRGVGYRILLSKQDMTEQ